MTLEYIFMNEYILQALEMVSAWNIPDEDFAQAVNDQAMLMAGVNPDDIQQRRTDTH